MSGRERRQDLGVQDPLELVLQRADALGDVLYVSGRAASLGIVPAPTWSISSATWTM